MANSRHRLVLFAGSLLVAAGLSGGCATVSPEESVVFVPPDVPRELDKRPLPEYVIEPPDILQIDALRLVPKAAYKIDTGDTLFLKVTRTFENEPIDGPYPVDVDGTIDLGPTYGGKVKVVDLTLDEARALVEKKLGEGPNALKGHKASIAVSPSRAMQQVRGPHLVRPDGTIGLGAYGAVSVVGLTIAEAKAAIESRLALEFQRPEVSVDVAAFNSKLFYVILDGAGFGEQVYRLPVTGNETVLDAIAQVSGLLPVSNKREIFVARPTPGDAEGDIVMPVDWVGLCMKGRTATNYQLKPGDRVYINSDPIVEFDTRLARILSPIERLLGITLLGNATIRAVDGQTATGVTGTGF
jgi:polysaccharide export outer membrane protein